MKEVKKSLATSLLAHCLFHLTSLISLFKSAWVFKRDFGLCSHEFIVK
jgi:hypothetical protein